MRNNHCSIRDKPGLSRSSRTGSSPGTLLGVLAVDVRSRYTVASYAPAPLLDVIVNLICRESFTRKIE